jgi:hypothetical protein
VTDPLPFGYSVSELGAQVLPEPDAPLLALVEPLLALVEPVVLVEAPPLVEVVVAPVPAAPPEVVALLLPPLPVGARDDEPQATTKPRHAARAASRARHGLLGQPARWTLWSMSDPPSRAATANERTAGRAGAVHRIVVPVGRARVASEPARGRRLSA